MWSASFDAHQIRFLNYQKPHWKKSFRVINCVLAKEFQKIAHQIHIGAEICILHKHCSSEKCLLYKKNLFTRSQKISYYTNYTYPRWNCRQQIELFIHMCIRTVSFYNRVYISARFTIGSIHIYLLTNYCSVMHQSNSSKQFSKAHIIYSTSNAPISI